MVSWLLGCAFVAAMAAGAVRARRAWDRDPSSISDVSVIDAALSIGVALGALAGIPTDAEHPWILSAAHITIPIVIGTIGLAWALVRGSDEWPPPSRGTVTGLVIAMIAMAGVIFAGGLGLAEGSAIGVAIGAWVWLGEARTGGRRSPRAAGAALWVMGGALMLGAPAVFLGLPKALAMSAAGIGALGAAAPMIRARPWSAAAMACITPMAAIAADTVVRVVIAAAAGGAIGQALGAGWIVGVAETLAARPVAALPGGMMPELCAAVATVGVVVCASKLPRGARILLGIGVGAAGAAVAVVAAVS